VLRGVLQLAAQIGEAKVHVLDVVFLDQVEDLAGVGHASVSVSSVWLTRTAAPGGAAVKCD
jgi:hypothetical protein